MGLLLRPPVLDDAEWLVSDIRDEDREEWCIASGKPIYYAVRTAILTCDGTARAVVDESGKCVALWGSGIGAAPNVGLAWMVATNQAARRVHSMHHLFRDGIARLHNAYPILHAWAYEKNTLHHTWMLRMGFADTHVRGRIGDGVFKLFVRRRELPKNVR